MKKIVITTFLLFVGTGMLSTASADRILDFGVISQANGSIGTDFSIDKAVLKLFNKELAKEEKEQAKEQRKNDLVFTTQAAEGVTLGDELIPAEGVALNGNNVEGNGITYTPVSDDVIITSSSVPEPGTAFLIGSGLIGLVGLKRKKFAKKA